MSDFTAAFEDLLDCQEGSTGTRPTVTIGDITADAFIEKLTYDEVIVSGGIAESGGFRLMMRGSDFPSIPPKNSPATYGSRSLYVLTVDDNNGTLELTIGDPAS